MTGFYGCLFNDLEKENIILEGQGYQNERYKIVFTGKIYNHWVLREELLSSGHEFTTESDDELIIALYHKYEEKVVHVLRGMFSFVIWDKETQILFGARDHFGIQPFFYSEQNEKLFWASEKKRIVDKTNGKLDHESLQHYMSFQYVPEPHTITQDIQKLEPGYYFIKKLHTKMVFNQYWTARFHPQIFPENNIIHTIRAALFDSVNVHMQGDVPVGAFLSGGIDSSIIVSIAKEVNPKIKTFSVGFREEGFSEIDIAQETAEVLGVENINYVISPEEYIAQLSKVIWQMEDPLADPAAIPLYFAARESSKHVKIVLSGEGADELFGGYHIYREPHSLRVFRFLPPVMKRVLRCLIAILPDGVKGKSFIERGITPLEERYIGNAKIFEEIEKHPLFVNYNHTIDYTRITEPIYALSRQYDLVTRMQHLDIHTWLRGDILLKAHRMTRAHGLELRVPFLDKEVFDVARKIHMDQKIHHKMTKYILRKAVDGIVPDHVLYRKKLGFPVPIRHWFKNELYDWVRELIQDSETDYLFHKVEIYRLLDEHATDKRDQSRKLWVIIVFMIWHRIFIENDGERDVENNEM